MLSYCCFERSRTGNRQFFPLQKAAFKGASDMVFCCCHGYPLNWEYVHFSHQCFFWHSCCTPSLMGTWHFWAQYDKPPTFWFGFPAVWWREEPFYVACLIRPLRTVIPPGFKQGWLYLESSTLTINRVLAKELGCLLKFLVWWLKDGKQLLMPNLIGGSLLYWVIAAFSRGEFFQQSAFGNNPA